MRKISNTIKLSKIAQVTDSFDPDMFSDEENLLDDFPAEPGIGETTTHIAPHSPEDRFAVAVDPEFKKIVFALSGGKDYDSLYLTLSKMLKAMDVDGELTENQVRALAGNYALYASEG
jgi:hypothetical protein